MISTFRSAVLAVLIGGATLAAQQPQGSPSSSSPARQAAPHRS